MLLLLLGFFCPKKKGRQMGTALLYIIRRMCQQRNECGKFEFNDILLYKKNDSELKMLGPWA